jgi:hypothetical protein
VKLKTKVVPTYKSRNISVFDVTNPKGEFTLVKYFSESVPEIYWKSGTVKVRKGSDEYQLVETQVTEYTGGQIR